MTSNYLPIIHKVLMQLTQYIVWITLLSYIRVELKSSQPRLFFYSLVP